MFLHTYQFGFFTTHRMEAGTEDESSEYIKTKLGAGVPGLSVVTKMELLQIRVLPS